MQITFYKSQVLNTLSLSKEEILSAMLWCSVYLVYIALLNKTWNQVLRIVDGYKDLIRTWAFSLFRLLENKKLEMFSIQERHQSKHKFGETKVCKAKEVRKYFINPKIENNIFG